MTSGIYMKDWLQLFYMTGTEHWKRQMSFKIYHLNASNNNLSLKCIIQQNTKAQKLNMIF